MTIEEILKLARENKGNDAIPELKSHRYIPQPDTEAANKALNPKLHDINNPLLRPDKRVKVTDDNQGESAQKVIDTGGESTNFRTVKVARVALALQKLIISRAVSFCFGNAPEYNSTPFMVSNVSRLATISRISEVEAVVPLSLQNLRLVLRAIMVASVVFPIPGGP